MKLTADTITDASIKLLGAELVAEGKYTAAMWCDYALISDPSRFDIPHGCDRDAARAKCATFINARGDK